MGYGDQENGLCEIDGEGLRVHRDSPPVPGLRGLPARGRVPILCGWLMTESMPIGGLADLRQAVVITHLPASLIGLVGAVVGFMMAANHGNELGMVFFVGLLPAVLLARRADFSRLSALECSKLERVVGELAALVGASDRVDPE